MKLTGNPEFPHPLQHKLEGQGKTQVSHWREEILVLSNGTVSGKELSSAHLTPSSYVKTESLSHSHSLGFQVLGRADPFSRALTLGAVVASWLPVRSAHHPSGSQT